MRGAGALARLEDEIGAGGGLRGEHDPVVQDDEAAVEEFADLDGVAG